MTIALLQVILFVSGGGRTQHTQSVDYQELIPVLEYYDDKHECDVREGGYLTDNFYIAECIGFWLVLDLGNLYWYRIRDSQI